MRAVVLHGAGDLRVEERSPPPREPGLVGVRIVAGGICGSDLHYFRHGRTGSFVVTEPLVLGHEIAGVVEEADAVAGLEPGTPVAVNPARFCGRCRACEGRRPNLCENLFFMGSASRTPHMQGGFREIVDVAPEQCFPVPPSLPLPHAALAEPLAVCLHAVGRAGPIEGRSVAIHGAGPIGLLLLLVCRLRGAASVRVVDVAEAPLRFAQRLGADEVVRADAPPENLTPPDVAFEASGSPAGLSAAMEGVRRGGIVVQVGNLAAGPLPIPANLTMSKELDLKGSLRFGHEFGEAVDLIASGAIDVSGLITAEASLADAPQAFALAADRSRSIKVVLRA
jgi:L-idonate 5-dehydrogenase